MQARFISSLRIQDDNGFPFTLLEDLVYVSEVPRKGGPTVVFGTIRVPTGFKTDLASIPQFLWNVLPPVGRYDRAAVLHDYLYQHNGCTRAEADAVLYEAMYVLGVDRFTRWTIYAGIRIGGWKVWDKYRKQPSLA